jgi:hypothetical protein
VSRHWVTLAGVVHRAGAPAGRAYVTVRDRDGNFTGERRTADGGGFGFALARARRAPRRRARAGGGGGGNGT